MSPKTTRELIVEAADRLLYEKGFEYTSFGDIADAVKISRGNVTFHFKTRDEILEAVIELRLERTRQMLNQWERESESAVDRIKCFINIVIANRAKILLYGCPVGTLCTELAKLEHSALPHASRVFGLFRDWLIRQFSQLGRKAEADALAMHVLAWSQGVATLASAFHDENFIRAEVRQLNGWVESLAASAQRKPAARLIRQTKRGRSATKQRP